MDIIDALFEEERKQTPYGFTVVSDKYRELADVRQSVYEMLEGDTQGFFSYLNLIEDEYALDCVRFGYNTGFKRAVKLILTECLGLSSSLINKDDN